MARKASRSFMLALKLGMPASANSPAMACRVRGRMAVLVRVNKMEAGMVLPPATFSMRRTSLTALAASTASSGLPCVGMMTRSARLIA